MLFSTPNVVYPVEQRVNLFFVLLFMSVLVGEIIKHKKVPSCQANFTTLRGPPLLEYLSPQKNIVHLIEQDNGLLAILCRTLRLLHCLR